MGINYGYLNSAKIARSWKMNQDSSVGRILSADEAYKFFEQVAEAEKIMGPLSREERLIILEKFGTDVTHYELSEMLKTKRALIVENKHES
jgi:Mg/Co/Ni transporter MgtE